MASVVKHTPDTFYLELRQDYILLCMALTYRKSDKSKSSPHCKALLLAIMERWTNDKISKKKDLYVYMTYEQWSETMYGMFKRWVILDSLDELVEEGLLTRERYKINGRDSYKYLLNVSNLNHRLSRLKIDVSSLQVDATGLEIDTSDLEVDASENNSSSDVSKNRHLIESKDTNKDMTKNEEKPSLTISPEIQLFFAFWKAYRHRKSAATINAKNIEQYEKLAEKIQTQEDFDSICALALSRLPSVNDGKLWLANLISCLDDWKMSKEQSQETPEGQEEDYIPGPMPADTYRNAGRICLKYHIRLKTSEYVIKELDRIYNQVQSKSRFERLMGESGEKTETIEAFFKQLEDTVPMEVEV